MAGPYKANDSFHTQSIEYVLLELAVLGVRVYYHSPMICASCVFFHTGPPVLPYHSLPVDEVIINPVISLTCNSKTHLTSDTVIFKETVQPVMLWSHVYLQISFPRVPLDTNDTSPDQTVYSIYAV